PGQDGQPGRIRRRVAERAEGVGLHVPDAFLGRVPFAVRVWQLDAARIGKQHRVAGACHAVQLIRNVVILVPDDEVGVAALAGVVAAAVEIRAVLVIALDHGTGGDGNGDQIALAGIVVNDDVYLGGAVAMHDVVRDAVQRAATITGAVLTPVGV